VGICICILVVILIQGVTERCGQALDNMSSINYKCTLSAITQKLNIPGHILIRTFFLFWHVVLVSKGHAVAYLVEALPYKPEGRGFESRYHWNFQLT
jgi:hypothetical protein